MMLFGPSDADTAAPMDLWIWTPFRYNPAVCKWTPILTWIYRSASLLIIKCFSSKPHLLSRTSSCLMCPRDLQAGSYTLHWCFEAAVLSQLRAQGDAPGLFSHANENLLLFFQWALAAEVVCVREGSSSIDQPLWWSECFSRSLCQTCSRPPVRCRHSGLHNSRSWGICQRSSAFLTSAR